ncbi:MAG TPA: hypothetical protein VHU23_00900 [Rhizomicrobium sp.]|jgi:streptogramin lyase|nr:hypothetical protein [Rhizomicrobium sp.]
MQITRHISCLLAILIGGVSSVAGAEADNAPKAAEWHMWTPLSQFDEFSGAVLGLDGRIWFADQTGASFVVFSEDGTFTTVPTGGYSFERLAIDPSGNIYATTGYYPTIVRFAPDGTTSRFTLGQDANGAITAGNEGSIWIPETSEIGRISADGSIREYPLAQGESLGGGTSTTQQTSGDVWFDASTSSFKSYLGAMNPQTGKIRRYYKDDCGGYVYPAVAAPDGRVWSVCGDMLYAQGYMDGFARGEKPVRVRWPKNFGFAIVGGYNNALAGSDNAIWITGQNVVNSFAVGAAFVRFDLTTHKFRKYLPPDDNYEWDASFTFDDAGNIWAGTENGQVQEIVLQR